MESMKIGVMEYWSTGVLYFPDPHYSITPILQFSPYSLTPVSPYSITPVSRGRRSDVDDDDAFGFEVVVQGLGAVLAADAAGLYAAEGEFIVTVVQ